MVLVHHHSPLPFSMPPDNTTINNPNQAAATYELEQLQLSRNSSNAAGSLRSRASSVISTGTKFSFSTLPQGTYHIDEVLERNNSQSSSNSNSSGHGNSNPSRTNNAAARPGSLYSVRSIATSLPPYEGHAPPPPSDEAALANTIILPTDGGGGDHVATTITPVVTERGIAADSNAQPPSTPTLDPENSLSMHYGRVVRHIDKTHRRQVARINLAHEQELAAVRDAIDKAYRKEFKAKDREIERIRAEAAGDVAAIEESKVREVDRMRDEGEAKIKALEGQVEAVRKECEEVVGKLRWEAEAKEGEMREGFEKAMEKACNAIEDVWEGRWKDRSRFGMEEARRRLEDRDGEWLEMIERSHPELVEEMSIAMNVAKR